MWSISIHTVLTKKSRLYTTAEIVTKVVVKFSSQKAYHLHLSSRCHCRVKGHKCEVKGQVIATTLHLKYKVSLQVKGHGCEVKGQIDATTLHLRCKVLLQGGKVSVGSDWAYRILNLILWLPKMCHCRAEKSQMGKREMSNTICMKIIFSTNLVTVLGIGSDWGREWV